MSVRIINADVLDGLRSLADESVHCVVTSPPYWGLRDYGVDGQIGREATLDEHIAIMVAVFAEVRRVLRSDGTMWFNYGDAYCSDPKKGRATPEQCGKHSYLNGQPNQCRVPPTDGLKPKDLLLLPARIALALQADGWWVRKEIIWHKPNPMPESVTDRPTSSHEKVYLMTKSEQYAYDAEAVKEPGVEPERQRYDRIGGTNGHLVRHSSGGVIGASAQRNLRDVWTIACEPFPEAHFATFPTRLAETCIKAGCPAGGTVLDPFGGSGTTGVVADRLGRDAVLIEINPEYVSIAKRRLAKDRLARKAGTMADVAAANLPPTPLEQLMHVDHESAP